MLLWSLLFPHPPVSFDYIVSVFLWGCGIGWGAFAAVGSAQRIIDWLDNRLQSKPNPDD